MNSSSEGPGPARADVPVDGSTFRHVVGHFASGVTVLTSCAAGRDFGMTVSAVSSLSVDPPMLLVCLNRAVPTEAAVRDSKIFCVNVLEERQGHLATQFSRPSENKFADVSFSRGAGGTPVLDEALATIECEVAAQVEAATHTVFLGQVRRARSRAGMPLTYFRGQFGKLNAEQHDATYRELRALILRRDVPVGGGLDPEALATRLAQEPAAVFSALARLAADGIVRQEVVGFRVAPFDVAAADAAFDARCVIELGIVDLTVGRLDAAQLAELQALLDLMSGYIVDNHFVDFGAYLRANDSLHRWLVSLAGSSALDAMYESLQIPAVMALAFGSSRRSSDVFVDVHRDLVAAYLSGDVGEARRAVRRYAELAKRRARTVLAEMGGAV